MTPTLLLDLDNTLLDNDMGTFIPAYLNGLAEALSARVAPDIFVAALLSAIRAMQENTDLRLTLKQVFDAVFYRHLGLGPGTLQPLFENYYAHRHAEIAGLTAPRPAAVKFLNWALARGHRVAIATNPLFPRVAINQRLAWAGLPAHEYDFALVCCYEEFHFAKPNPAFYAEVLARLGWPEGPVLVVGDDAVNDIQSAARLGVPSYFVHPNGGNPREGPAAGSGPIDDLAAWLEAVPLESLQPALDTREAVLATFQTSHAAISALLDGDDPGRLRTRPSEGEWSLTEILCHFRDVDAEVTLPRLDTILSSQDAFIPAVDPDTWAEPRRYREQDPMLVLEDWLNRRSELVERLAALDDADWQRRIRHSIFGPTTLFELLQFSARHDRLHIQQAAQTRMRLS